MRVENCFSGHFTSQKIFDRSFTSHPVSGCVPKPSSSISYFYLNWKPEATSWLAVEGWDVASRQTQKVRIPIS